MSPCFSAAPDRVATRLSSAPRSGRRAASIGVGTVTMKKSAAGELAPRLR